jgi:hypothetical protein
VIWRSGGAVRVERICLLEVVERAYLLEVVKLAYRGLGIILVISLVDP